jgi:hypothetical protein
MNGFGHAMMPIFQWNSCETSHLVLNDGMNLKEYKRQAWASRKRLKDYVDWKLVFAQIK